MVRELDSIENHTLRERIERGIVKPIIAAKAKFGLGVQPYHGFHLEIFRMASEMKVT